MSELLLRRVEFVRNEHYTLDPWHLEVPAIAEICSDGLLFENSVTVIVGENGVGKSTLVEAIAESWRSGMRRAEDDMWAPGGIPDDGALSHHLRCDGVYPRPTNGGFLRAEAMINLFARADATRVRETDPSWSALSHGQSFLRYIAERPVGQGLWLLDEPEAALSFQSCLALLGVLIDLAAEGSQVIMATHSPLLAACPDAEITELTEDGIEYREWDQLDMVRNWRAFLDSPQHYLRHL
ncbi:AAA family ATPase [Nocardia blacklockiae]|uniref:AAA family ATPase n=1 Tax=Nocardia blacklockiae TaxID=480036 RepID=UPI0018937719|nr:AAA family ATPase [Nocardia blacklockiae]MBF6174539.1 AAA family ATPase [Nocardia blacklockiae]